MSLQESQKFDITQLFAYQHQNIMIGYYLFEPMLMMLAFKTMFLVLRVCFKQYSEPLADQPQTKIVTNLAIIVVLWIVRVAESIIWLPEYYFTTLAQGFMFIEWMILFGSCCWIVSDHDWRSLSPEQQAIAKYNYSAKAK